MQFERDRRQAHGGANRPAERGVVDALVVNDQDLWLVVARQDEPIYEWLHGEEGEEVASLRVCRTLPGGERLVIRRPDPYTDHLLSQFEDSF